MSTALESFLARLYTDPSLRAEFLRDRRGTAEAAGLSATAVGGLVNLNEFALALTSQVFDRKRARRTASSPAVTDTDKLRQSRKARIIAQARELRIDINEHKLRFVLLRRAIEIHKRLTDIAKRGRHLGQVVTGHVLRRGTDLEAMDETASGLRVAAKRRDVSVEGERL
jgi:hypothetical protein